MDSQGTFRQLATARNMVRPAQVNHMGSICNWSETGGRHDRVSSKGEMGNSW